MHRSFLWVLAAIGAGLLAGCAPDLGECDPAAAHRLYYTDDDLALPAYGGQALVISSCGGGSFCHSEAVEGVGRDGAPAGLDFDLAVADTAEQTERLRAGIAHVRDNAESIWTQVDEGFMPPGEAGAAVVELSPRYAGLPPVDTPQGKEIVRNWLACGAPVVERTTPRPAGIEPVGDVVSASTCSGTLCGGACVDLATDGAHCGSCGNDCGPGAVCVDGSCVAGGCPLGTTECGGGCVDTLTSDLNCGGCGNVCGSGTGCVDGSCVATACASGLVQCGGECVDTDVDGQHCGACDVACGSSEVCMGGTCMGCDASVTFSGSVQPIFTSRCTDSRCHGGIRPQASLRLEAGSAYGELVGVASSCLDGRPLVDPGNPDGSYILAKLTGVGMCSGNRMPLRRTPLSAADIGLIRNWICTGALDN